MPGLARAPSLRCRAVGLVCDSNEVADWQAPGLRLIAKGPPKSLGASASDEDEVNSLQRTRNRIRREFVQFTHMATLTTTISGKGFPMAPRSRTASSRPVSFETASEEEVVRRAKAGDELAFAEIIQRHQNMVYSVAYRMVRRRIDAEDVAQQVFAKIFFAMKKFNMRSSLSTWIYRIALNETYDYLRRLKNQRVFYEGDMGENVDEFLHNSARAADRQPGVAAQSEKRDYLIKLLAHVSAEERMLLFQKEVEGHTVRELSSMTGINQNTIKVKLFRARKKLAKAAAKLESEGSA